jgi:NADPH2:quinone reductase
MTVRLAAALGASAVVATARSPEHLAALTALVDAAVPLIPVPLGDPDPAAMLSSHGLAQGVDVVVDMVGASVFAQTLDAAAIGGRIVQVGRLGGRITEIYLD